MSMVLSFLKVGSATTDLVCIYFIWWLWFFPFIGKWCNHRNCIFASILLDVYGSFLLEVSWRNHSDFILFSSISFDDYGFLLLEVSNATIDFVIFFAFILLDVHGYFLKGGSATAVIWFSSHLFHLMTMTFPFNR